MVKSVLGMNHVGLRDWLIQRISAIVMIIYIVGIFIYFLLHPQINFTTWQQLFSSDWMKVGTLLFITSLLFHAWVGMWTIITDYIPSFVCRFILHILIFLSLAACFFESLLMLWSR